MKRFAVRTGKLAAAVSSAGVLLFSCGESQLAAQPTGPDPITVLEVRCLNPGDAELVRPVHMITQDGTVVSLRCGGRVEVSGGVCRVRRGDQVTAVPCAEEPRPVGLAGVLPVTESHGS